MKTHTVTLTIETSVGADGLHLLATYFGDLADSRATEILALQATFHSLSAAAVREAHRVEGAGAFEEHAETGAPLDYLQRAGLAASS